MNVLALGDVVGDYAVDHIGRHLNKIKKEYDIDFCVANGENSASGNGITIQSANKLFALGVDVITGGNHTFRRREIYDYLDNRSDIIRPANYSDSVPGHGFCINTISSGSVAVINLLGSTYMNLADNPFTTVDKILDKLENQKYILVDFHAEATSEKLAMAHFLDGRVSALFGTHTHVQTADEQILPGGTGYITDLGMCGAADGILGIEKQAVIDGFLTYLPQKFVQLEIGRKTINGCVFVLNNDGKCDRIERIKIL